MIPQRGEVWLTALDPTVGSEMRKTRPAVVLSSPVLYPMPVRIIAPITAWQAKFDARAWIYVRLQPTPLNGLLKESAADPSQVRCVAVERLTRRLGILTPEEIEDIAAGVALCIGYPS